MGWLCIIFRNGDEEEQAEARNALGKAILLIEQRMKRINNPGLRASFINNVPLVKEILSLGQELER